MTKRFEFDLPVGEQLATLFPNTVKTGKRRIKGQTQSSKAIAEVLQAFIDDQKKKNES